MREKLEINNVLFSKMDFEIVNLYELTQLPDKTSGVIFEDGLYVKCGFAEHSSAFAVGAFIYLAHHAEEEKWVGVYNDIKKVLHHGVLDTEDMETLISLYGMMSHDSGNVKRDNPEVYDKVKGARFIGAKNNPEETNEVIRTLAENWIKNNGKYIWAMRCCLHIITNEDFFEEQSKSEWNELLSKNAGIELPSLRNIPFFGENPSAFLTQIKIPNLIGRWGEDSECDFYDLTSRYPRMLELAGREAIHGSDWPENFFISDNDDLIFALEKKGRSLEW